MSFTDVIKELDFDTREEKDEFLKMGKLYELGLPNVLYSDPYELHELTGIHNVKWKKFLKLPQLVQLIEVEIALMAEVKARAALQKLGEDKLDSSGVAAVKALLEKSKMLQGKVKDSKTIIFHHIPLDDEREETDSALHPKENK